VDPRVPDPSPTQATNASVGIDLALLDRDYAVALTLGRGTNVCHSEGQPGRRAPLDPAHHGVDQQTAGAPTRWRGIRHCWTTPWSVS
jgi:ethanolamine ammonia-lyase large subunit